MKKQNIIFSTLLLTLPLVTQDVFAGDNDAATGRALGEFVNETPGVKMDVVGAQGTKNICVVVMGENGEYLNNATVTEKGNQSNKAKPANYFNQHCIDIPNSSELIISAEGYETKTAKASSLSDGDYGAIKLKENRNAAASSARSATEESTTIKANARVSAPSTSSASTGKITVSGTVSDEEGRIPAAQIIVMNENGTQEIKKDNGPLFTVTNNNGEFSLSGVPSNAKLKIHSNGSQDKIVDAGQNLDITLATSDNIMKEVPVVENHHDGDVCSGQALTDPYAVAAAKGKYKKIGDTWVCVPNECVQDYKLKGNVCVKYKCSTDEEESIIKSGAKGAKWDGTKCVPSKCDTDNGYTENENNECVLTNCTKAQLQELKQQQGVADGKLEKETCVPICKKNYHRNGSTCKANKCPTDEEDWNGKECVKVRCTEEQKQAIYAKEAKWENNTCVATDCEEDKNFKLESGKCICKDPYTLQNGACVNADILAKKQKAYDDAKAKEQSLENRTLTAVTTAATGIGGMQALQGMAEQSADEDAMADMAAYIETMRCTYADGKQVKAGPEEIELPGANDQELMNLRGQYLALAQDLKERKEALGMKPGIESEVIMDRAQTGLYDDENIGITGGNYASIYRAMMLNSETDQAKIDDAKSTSANRVKYGAIAAGAGVVGGIVGNSLINGKLGEKIKSAKEKKDKEKNEKQALEKLQKCLKDGGAKKTSDLKFDNFTPSVLHLEKIYCSGSVWNEKVKNKDATTLFADTTDEATIKTILIKNFDCDIAGKLLDEELCNKTTENTSTQQQHNTQNNTQNNSINSSTRKKYDSFIVDRWGKCWKIEDYIFSENSQNYKAELLSLTKNDYELNEMEWMSIINDTKITGESKCEYLEQEKEIHCLCKTKSPTSSWTNVLTLTTDSVNYSSCDGLCPAYCAANADKL